ncbi:MAG: DUF4831 family protein [Bacteroidales bacterium]|jgi:hypothetical protein|nr:DUF4831 family protein [Bacteroidales bacterium]
MKKRYLWMAVLALTAFSCKTTSETKVSKIDDLSYQPEHGIIYALPKTTLRFTVEALRTDIIPGPYYEYAEKYLGMSDVPREEYSDWKISNILIDSYHEIDPEQFYMLEPEGKLKVNLPKLIENGSIMPVNLRAKEQFPNDFYGFNDPGKEVVFTDLSVKRYIGEERVTYYKRVQRDSLFAKVPVVKTQSVTKTFEDKAEEAANFIFMIREKRFELLTGMADFYPEGESLEAAVEELNNLESEYLSLFIGKKFTSTYRATFEFSPGENDLSQPHILFRYSDERGVLPPNDLRGRPIIVELEKMNHTKNLDFLLADRINREGTSFVNKLFYRIPDQAFIHVVDGNKLLAKRKLTIEQFGTVVQIPSVFLMDEEKFIEFYREDE